MITVALATAYPTETAARDGIAEEHPGQPDGPYRGRWRLPPPYGTRVHLFATQPDDELIARGWQPECVAPDCPHIYETSFTADEEGRFAGRDWVHGDVIRLCWPHAADVYATQGVADPAKLAEWLRPDAADPPNTWHPERAW